MNQDERFVQDLRSLLSRAAPAGVPAAFREQVVGVSYRRPKSMLLGPHRLLASGLAAALIVVAFVVVVVGVGGLGSAGSQPSPSADPRVLPVGWPLQSAPPGFEATARAECGPMVNVDYFSSLPLVVEQHRSGGGATYWAAVFADDTWTAACMVQGGPGGSAGGLGGGSASGARWTSHDGIVMGHVGLAIVFGGSAVHPLDWNTAMGTVPAGAASVRMVVDGRAAEGVVADGLYSVAWQGLLPPDALIAYDARGNEIDRIERSALAQIFEPTASPS